MNPRVHVCSVERANEPDLGSKLLRLSTACEEIVEHASTLNSNVRCTVNGAYLSCAKMRITGFSHVDDRVMDKLTLVCEREFGQNMVGLELMKHGTPSICISCSFGAEQQGHSKPGIKLYISYAALLTMLIVAIAFGFSKCPQQAAFDFNVWQVYDLCVGAIYDVVQNIDASEPTSNTSH